MTVTNENEPGAARKIVVRDQVGPLEFYGELVADLSWTNVEAEQYGHHRWTNLTLYRVLQDGSAYAYALQVVGRSVMYHRAGGDCKSGQPRTVASLKGDSRRWDELKVCPKCYPEDLEDMTPTTVVFVEEDIPTLFRCVDASEVVKVLHGRSRRERGSNGLSLKLLQISSERDEEIAKVLRQARSL
jgi:hypothetical protein